MTYTDLKTDQLLGERKLKLCIKTIQRKSKTKNKPGKIIICSTLSKEKPSNSP